MELTDLSCSNNAIIKYGNTSNVKWHEEFFISKKEMGVQYLPLWATTSTGTQDMLPALLSGLVYSINL